MSTLTATPAETSSRTLREGLPLPFGESASAVDSSPSATMPRPIRSPSRFETVVRESPVYPTSSALVSGPRTRNSSITAARLLRRSPRCEPPPMAEVKPEAGLNVNRLTRIVWNRTWILTIS